MSDSKDTVFLNKSVICRMDDCGTIKFIIGYVVRVDIRTHSNGKTDSGYLVRYYKSDGTLSNTTGYFESGDIALIKQCLPGPTVYLE